MPRVRTDLTKTNSLFDTSNCDTSLQWPQRAYLLRARPRLCIARKQCLFRDCWRSVISVIQYIVRKLLRQRAIFIYFLRWFVGAADFMVEAETGWLFDTPERVRTTSPRETMSMSGIRPFAWYSLELAGPNKSVCRAAIDNTKPSCASRMAVL